MRTMRRKSGNAQSWALSSSSSRWASARNRTIGSSVTRPPVRSTSSCASFTSRLICRAMLAILLAQLLSDFSKIEFDEIGVIDHPLCCGRCGVAEAHAFHEIVARGIHFGFESIQGLLKFARPDLRQRAATAEREISFCLGGPPAVRKIERAPPACSV